MLRMNYIKVYTDFLPILEPLKDEEIGRLFVAMLRYAETGEEPTTLVGQEAILWAVCKRDIDVTAKKAKNMSDNGAKGGRGNKNQDKANESNEKQTKANESRKSLHTIPLHNIPLHTIPNHNNNNTEDDPLTLTDEEVHESITRDQAIEDAARDVGLMTSTQAMMEARDLADQYGLDELLKAIRASMDVPKWAYVKGILKNGGVNEDGHTSNSGKSDASPYSFLHGREATV